MPSEITFETTETNCVCMIVFHCAHVRNSKSTCILTSIVTYLPYRLSDVTRLADKLQDTTYLDWKATCLGLVYLHQMTVTVIVI